MITFRFRGGDVAGTVIGASDDHLIVQTADGQYAYPWREILTPPSAAGADGFMAVPRSGKWARVRAEHLVKHPACAACGGVDHLQVHHVKPFHAYPELELEPSNLLTLCERPGANHHLDIGHLGCWRSYNTNAVADASYWLIMSKCAVQF